MNERDQARQVWLEKNLKSPGPLMPLTKDASFRRYFRVQSEDGCYVLMDAPPLQESCHAFIAIDRTLRQLGLDVPTIYCADSEQGFLLLSDFGDQQLLGQLNNQTVDHYYQKACEALLMIQRCHQVENYQLPTFDEALYNYEWGLFCEWYLERHLGVTLSAADQKILDSTCHLLRESALLQPQVCIHRDYHSRNLMILPDDRLGVLDFQDAVWGPITYDVMSLLRDCYIEWPFERVKQWLFAFQRRLLEENLLNSEDPEQFLLWFDWIALQRHLKCIGIFSRLHYRDNKSIYLRDIPRVLRYAKSVCERHTVFESLLARFIQ